MMNTKTFLIFLNLLISFSVCLEEILNNFNVTKIEPFEDACSKEHGQYDFKIICDSEKPLDTVDKMVYTYLDNPVGCRALCFPSKNLYFGCYFSIVECPLTKKKITLSKRQPYSYGYYIFNNWEEYITQHEHDIFPENIDCTPSIRNTFIYSSLEKHEDSFTIKGEWFNQTQSLTPTIAGFFTLKVQSSTTSEITCTYNLEKKTEFDCTFNGESIPQFEDQVVKISDNYIYKIEKKNDDGNKSLGSYIIFDILLFLLLILLNL